MNLKSVVAEINRTSVKHQFSREKRFEFGLLILSELPAPEEGWTIEIIADFCGCSSSTIHEIEVRFLKTFIKLALQFPNLSNRERSALTTNLNQLTTVKRELVTNQLELLWN